MRDAGARGLALAAAAAGLALARADAAADALARLAAPALSVISFSFISIFASQSGIALRAPASLARSRFRQRRCSTLAIMPRIAGVSSRSATRPILLSPRPFSVARWSCVAARRAADLRHLDGLLAACSMLMACSPCFTSSPRFGIDVAAARLQRRNLDIAARGDRARRILTLQRLEGRRDHVVRVRGADRLRHHVLHAERLEHRAHRTAGDDAGAGRRGAQDTPCRRRGGRRCRDAACGLRAAARGSAPRLAASVALRIASGTSRALPWP